MDIYERYVALTDSLEYARVKSASSSLKKSFLWN